MRKEAIITFSYAVLLLIGGLIGFFKANSIASLVVSGSAFVFLALCSYYLLSKSNKAHVSALCLSVFLALFFAYRFALSFKFMPGGLMALLSIALCIYLAMRRKKGSQAISA